MKWLTIILMSITTVVCQNPSEAETLVQKTEEKFRSVNDYQVDMTISIKIPAFRMPKKNYTVYFKQPDQIKIKSRGFGLLPRTGMFTSPIENFNNLTNVQLSRNENLEAKNSVVLKGDLIVDSLSVDMPNDYAKLTFKPQVRVMIDTANWVITNVRTSIDTIKIMEISNTYDIVDDEFYLPSSSKVEYYVKDARFAKWIKQDLGNIMGRNEDLTSSSEMVRGEITVSYKNYRVNKGIDDKIFK